MLTILGTLLSAVFGGGATGLAGVLLQRFFDTKSKALDIEVLKVKNAHELELRNIDRQVMMEEWKGRERVAAEEGAAAVEVEALRTLAASYEADKARYVTPDAQSKSRFVRWAFGFVDTVRGLTRPVLTAYLVWVASALYAEVQAMAGRMGVVFTPQQVAELQLQIVTTLLYLATVSVVWWFGTRPTKQAKDN